MTPDDLRIFDTCLWPPLPEGLIEMVIPDKIRSRNQRYRPTPAGCEFLRQSEENK